MAGWEKTVRITLAVVLAGTIAIGMAPAYGKGDSGKGESRASGRSGKDHAGHRHSGRHSNRARDAWEPGVWPWLSYAPYPVVAMAPVPVQYVERIEQEAQPADHWLYCAEAQGYFPYVGVCPEGWERVPSAPIK